MKGHKRQISNIQHSMSNDKVTDTARTETDEDECENGGQALRISGTIQRAMRAERPTMAAPRPTVRCMPSRRAVRRT